MRPGIRDTVLRLVSHRLYLMHHHGVLCDSLKAEAFKEECIGIICLALDCPSGGGVIRHDRDVKAADIVLTTRARWF